jgi:hypothetical protein
MEERRLQEEVERKKQEKDTLLVKVAELDAQIALSRHKIQILSDRIRGERLRGNGICLVIVSSTYFCFQLIDVNYCLPFLPLSL